MHDRDAARAKALLQRPRQALRRARCALPTDLEREIAAAAGVVNATPDRHARLSRQPDAGRRSTPSHWCADVIYTPLDTEFIKARRGQGRRVMNGGGMCVHQAAEAFRLFTGLDAGRRAHASGFCRRLRRARSGGRQSELSASGEKNMKTSIATVCLSGGLSEKLEAIAAAGFRSVEIFESDLLSYNGTPADVAKEMADLGLKPITFQPFRDFEGMPEPQRQRTFDRAERKFDLMQELGCDLLMVCSNVSPESLGGIDRAAADFRELGERAAKRGLRVGFEALAWGRHINDYRDAWEVVRRADHPAIGLVLDSFHTFARKTDLKPMHSIPGDRIFLVQLADAPWLDMDVLSWSRHFRCFPGQGDLPLLDFMTAVAGDRLSRRPVAGDFQRPVPRRLAALGRGRRPALAGLSDGPDARKERTSGSGLPKMPPRSKCLGVEFIEFAVDDRAGRRARALLARARISQRRAPQIESGVALDSRRDQPRHQQGEGRLRAFALHHARASVCAIGLKVESASDARPRREAA